jgi:hypothetical protein
MKRNSHTPVMHLFFSLLVGGGLWWAAPALGGVAPGTSDVVTVGTVTAPGNIIGVPVFIRDTSGTPLGLDQPPGSRIQSFSIKVDYPVSPFITGVTFTRAGITSTLTPTFESSPSVPGSISLIATFPESTDLIPFTLDGALPGNQIGQLTFTFSPSTPPGTVVPLTIDGTLTQLSDQGGTLTETEQLGTLSLIDGSITVAASTGVPTLDEWALLLLAASLVFIAVRMRM